MKYAKKTKSALWTQTGAAKKRLEAAAASRKSAKAQLLSARRDKVAARAIKRRLARPRAYKRVAPRSAAMAGKMKAYGKAKADFLAFYIYCRRCGNPSHRMEIHHSRGRVGALLLDVRFWMAVCPACHRWIHDHVDEARERNLIAQPGDWNNPL